MASREYQRRTCDASCFPPLRQFWADTVTGDLMWDIAYLHSALKRTDCIEHRKLWCWSQHFTSLVCKFPGNEVYLRDPSCAVLSQHNVANTTAIITYLWMEASVVSKTRSWKCFAYRVDVYASYLNKAATHAIASMQSQSDKVIESPYGNLQIQTDGSVFGLLPMLKCHQHVIKVFEEHWKVLETEGKVRNSFDADRHGIVDIITFGVTCIQYRRRASRRPLSASTWARWRATDYSERHTYTA